MAAETITVPIDLVLDKELSNKAKAVYCILRTFLKVKSQPKLQQLAQVSNLTISNLKEVLDELDDAGWIGRMGNGFGGVLYDTYTTPFKVDTKAIFDIKYSEKKSKANTGYIYLWAFEIEGYYKIGKAKNIPHRISEVRLPFDVTVVHQVKSNNYHKAEIFFHKHFAGKRGNGEWFKLSQEDIEWFKSHEELNFTLPEEDLTLNYVNTAGGIER